MRECQHCGRLFEARFENQPLCDECLSDMRARYESGATPEDLRSGPVNVPQAPKRQRPDFREYLKSPTWILIGLNLLAFIAEAIASRGVSNFKLDTLIAFGANSGAHSLSDQPWRLLTSMFLHGDIFHFLFNMWALLNLGILAELLFGTWPFIGLYLLAGLGGSIASSWWHTSIVSVGASGAIFGIAGALLPALALHPNPRLRAALRGSLASIGFFVVYNLIYGAAATRTDNAAHLGGLIVGVALGFALPAIPGASEQFRARRVLSVLLGVVVLTGCFFAARSHRRGEIQSAKASQELAIAVQYFQSRDYSQALSYAQRSIQHDPTLASSQFLIGNIYSLQGDHARALDYLRRAVELKPDFAPGFAQLCVASVRMDKLPEAESACRRASQLAPLDSDNFFNLGLTLRAVGKPEEAVDAFGRAVKLRPNGVAENYYYGVSLLQVGEIEKGIAALTRAQQLKPDDEDIAAALARAKAWAASK